MSYSSDPLVTAEQMLAREVRRRNLASVAIRRESESWLLIDLANEKRQLWLGHSPTEGYFITWDRDTPATGFFKLNEESIKDILAVLPSTPAEPEDLSSTKLGRTLVEEIKASTPDVDTISDAVDESHPSDAGLDILATLTTMKKHRRAIDRLRELIATQDAARHIEKTYLDLVTEHPWMLGTEYSEVVQREVAIWFGSRVDLLLKSALGYIDVAELKRPDMPLVERGSRKETWRATKALSDAVAQARKYLRIIDEQRHDITRALKLTETSGQRLYRSSVIIVAGRNPAETDALDALREMRTETGRLLILTYDDVLAVAESTIRLFERRLAKFPPSLGGS